MDFKVVIPARYGSSRLPGKPLADLGGEPMIVRVVRQACRSAASEVVVATDDARVLETVTAAGGQARMTRPDHVSGSDRVMEVADLCGWPDHAVVINVQGDEPLIPPAVIDQVAALLEDPEAQVATLCEPIDDLSRVFDPNVVKVVGGADGCAIYFSRAPIPYARDAFAGSGARQGPPPEPGAWQRHIGIYGYRVQALRRFVGLPPGRLEQLEALEQLRLVEHGVPIRLAAAVAVVPAGVDTPADLRRVRAWLGSAR